MMIRTFSYTQQDTVPRKIVIQDTVRENTAAPAAVHQQTDSLRPRIASVRKIIPVDNSDTTSVCSRNSVADVTFYDFNNFIFRLGQGSYKQFPYIFIEKAGQRKAEERSILLKSLKPGTDLPQQPLHSDWVILIIILATLLFAVVRKTSANVSERFSKFFLLRGTNDPGSRDIGGLFYWQSTILNLVSFIVIALFGYSAAAFYNIIPEGVSALFSWLVVLVTISAAVTLRHFTCIIAGAASGRQDVFSEYLLGIYQAYRFAALFLFFIVVLISYTTIIPVNNLIISGLIVIALLYLIRVVRLLIIFLNRNISIFYLILYLCALEILPVLVVAKFITGLV